MSVPPPNTGNLHDGAQPDADGGKRNARFFAELPLLRQADDSFDTRRCRAAPDTRAGRIVWAVPLVGLTHLAGLALLVSYSRVNLHADLTASGAGGASLMPALVAMVAAMGPTLFAWLYVRPLQRWLRRATAGPGEAIPRSMARRAANLPLVVAGYATAGWMLVVVQALLRGLLGDATVSAPLLAHLVLRPLLVGLVVAAAVLFVTEAVCRASVWPSMLGGIRITGNRQLWRLRTGYRLLALWVTVSVIPLGAVALTTYARVAGTEPWPTRCSSRSCRWCC